MILNGKPVAQKIYSSINFEKPPTLAVILVGEDPASLTYIKVKEKILENLGITFKLFHLPGFSRETKILELVEDLNKNKFIDGIVVQLPLPADLNTKKILAAILPHKDIDGFSGEFMPPTIQAILEILNYYKISYENKNIVIVGHGLLVGKPLEEFLIKKGIKPIICDSETSDLKSKTLEADILISGAGATGLIKPEMVKSDATIIDAGTAESNGEMVGDVDPKVYEKVKAYTPVPGGVGPVTVACLMRNLVEAARQS